MSNNEESTSSFAAFPNSSGKAPDLQDWVQSKIDPNAKRAAPAPGSSPEQVRAHYSGQATNNPTELPSVEPIGVAKYSPPLPTSTGANYQNQVNPEFHSSSQGISVDLPSEFVPYQFKELYVHPFKGKHLSKLARAASERSPRIMAEVVSSILEVPGTQIGGLAFRLTMPDYYWVLYFQRRSCYTKVSFNHTTRCTNHKHIQQVMEGKLTPESLIIKSTIDVTSLSSRNAKEVDIPECIKDLEPHCTTVGTFVLMVEDSRFGNEDYNYTATLAAVIMPNLPWEQRLAIAEELSVDQVEALKAYEKESQDYGVTEEANVTCPGCSASIKTKLSIDASSFLPSA